MLAGYEENAGQAYILCAFAALPATGVLPLILGTPKADWLAEFPRPADLIALRPSGVVQPGHRADSSADVGLGAPTWPTPAPACSASPC
ncbi:hypothetical protein P4123_14550 [Pseudomonas aeruginosa]|nr:hypothetical protein [Pseudomonas aeruginosa]